MARIGTLDPLGKRSRAAAESLRSRPHQRLRQGLTASRQRTPPNAGSRE